MATPARGEARAGGIPRPALGFIRAVDTLSEWSGQIFCWLILPLMLGVTYEVLARYAFNAPTIWAYDMAYMLYGSHFMLGAAYALLKGGHIRTDMLYQNWSPRRQGAIDAVCYLFLFFPAMLFLLWMGGTEFLHSYSIGERSDASPWRPILYPLKGVIPLTAIMLLLQGISEFLKSVYAVRTNRLFAKREAIEI